MGGISSSGRESWPGQTFNYPELETKKRAETGFGREKDENPPASFSFYRHFERLLAAHRPGRTGTKILLSTFIEVNKIIQERKEGKVL